MVGAVIGNYQLVRKLGQGGMGAVYLGQHMLLGRRAAIKVLLPALSARTDVVSRFFNEARAVTSISDLGIVQVFDFGYHTDGSAFIVMEFLEGEPLDHRLARMGRLPVDEALRLCRQVAGSLAAAHAQHIIHRDLKPENIFLVRDAEMASGERTKILDFGIAKLSDEQHPSNVKTHTGMLVGTPKYMSPEQCRGIADIDHRSDIYALGCVLFHLLAGRPPFEGEGIGDIISAHIREPARPPSSQAPGIPPRVDALVLRCLAKAPADRFQTMIDLAAAIGSLLQQMPAGAPANAAPAYHSLPTAKVLLEGAPTPTTLRANAGQFAPAAPRPRRIGFWIAGALVFGAVGTGIAIVGTGNDRPRNILDTPRGGSNSELQSDAGEGSAVIAEHPDIVLDAPAVTGNTVEPVPVKPDDEKSLKIGKCTELSAQKDWQGLEDCAVALDALGDKTKAKTFHDKARQETRNDGEATKGKQALRDGNLQDVQASLKLIGPDSVYYASLNDLFVKAEAPVVEEARRKAQGYANAHDCTTLRRYITQLATTGTGTARVIATAQGVKCTEKTQVADPVPGRAPVGSATTVVTPPPKSPCDSMDVDDVMKQAANQYGAGYAKSALQLMKMALDCQQSVTMDRMAGMYACAAHDLPDAKFYFNKVPESAQKGIEQKCQLEGLYLGGSAKTTVMTPPVKNPCDTMDVEDTMKQAANQYGSGYAKSALQLLSKALACKQSVTMYRMAGMYACAAHDLSDAKLYFNKVPASAQADVEQKCQLEGLNLRGP